ncbi:MAG: arsenate reductase ArsC [Spirochaetales bacterium]|nr:MAG: arsenate reductase ArsC [Spirochaetales bacterium]
MEGQIPTKNSGKAKRVLFVCTHNSGRSQMAEAFFNEYAPPHLRAISAGSQPAERLNQTVVNAMKERDIDISSQKPKALTVDMLDSADIVITMGCMDSNACPAAFVPTIDWGLDDPEGQPIRIVRQIRDAIESMVKQLIEQKFNEKLTSP